MRSASRRTAEGSTLKNVEKIKKILSENKLELKEKYHVTEIGIFGSYVRGEQKRKSDIDILVDLKEPVSLLELVGIENHIADILKMKVDLVPKKDIRPELRARILKETVYI